MIIDQKLSMLHERLNIFLNSVSVFSFGERLDKHTLTLGCLNLLDPICINIELFQEFKSSIWMTIRCFQVVK